MRKTTTVNYLNNKDILKEINKSKLTYCFVQDEKYNNYDIIVGSVAEITDSAIDEARRNKSAKVQSEGYAVAMSTHDRADYKNKPKQKEFAIDPESFDIEELVFRVTNMDHIPEAPGRKKNPKTEADTKAKVNFPAFKHYAYQNNELVEVVRSHWLGSLSNGDFSIDHGRITNKLGTMFLKLVERYSHRANWRGYTYVDEMRGQALVQLSQIGLQFNESKSDNPFAYYTAVVNNSFTRVLNIEKRNQNIRDDILIEQGHLPSFSRQIKHEDEIRSLRELAETEIESETKSAAE
jgi:hypothetical protein|tara:strand:+ start:1041 stop:1919 length:879 start_codon:yes stop_codon:yes gene_type:complete